MRSELDKAIDATTLPRHAIAEAYKRYATQYSGRKTLFAEAGKRVLDPQWDWTGDGLMHFAEDHGQRTEEYTVGQDRPCICDTALDNDGWCIHSAQFHLYTEAKRILRRAETLPAEPEPPTPEPAEDEMPPHDEMPEPVSQYPPEQVRVNKEPHSVTLRAYTSDGFELMPCIRGHDIEQVMRDVTRTLQWFRAIQAQPIRVGQTQPARVDNGAPPPVHQEPSALQPMCPVHNIPMEERTNRKDNSTFWSHKAGSEWCNGHWCLEHQTRFFENHKDGRTWYSHKAADGSWCNEKKEW